MAEIAMKRVLLLLDSDPIPNAYDVIVAYDGGADHVVSYGGMTPGNVGPLIDGAVFTRASPTRESYQKNVWLLSRVAPLQRPCWRRR
jgi:hypothetical protein